jgi:hypothetical protein
MHELQIREESPLVQITKTEKVASEEEGIIRRNNLVLELIMLERERKRNEQQKSEKMFP